MGENLATGAGQGRTVQPFEAARRLHVVQHEPMTTRVTIPYDLADPTHFSAGIPHDLFASLRAAPGLSWNEDGPHGRGFWAVTRHADVVTVSRDPATFSSEVGHIQIYDIDDDVRAARASMIDLDPPIHTHLRRLVSSAFTPKRVQEYLPSARRRIRAHLDDFIGAGGGDWAQLVANPIPIGVICEILGVPDADHGYLVELTDHLVEGTSGGELDPSAYGNTRPLRELPFNSPAAFGIDDYARDLRTRRLADPHDDIVTALATVEVDGARLTETEFARFFQLMIFAGNETTRSALSHLALLHTTHAEVFDAIRSEDALLEGAVEEVVRHASPILYFRRTATTDTDLSGTQVLAGDKVVMYYASANFDEAVFHQPLDFDIARTNAKAEVGFGGGGVHFCLGAPLARLELGIVLEELTRRNVTFELDGDVRYVESNFVNGIERLPLRIC